MMNLPKLLSLTLIGFFWATESVDNKQPKWLGDLPLECLELVESFSKHSIIRCAPCSLAMLKIANENNTISHIDKMIKRCWSDDFSHLSMLGDKEKEELCLKLKSYRDYVEQNSDLIIKYAGPPYPREGHDSERLQILWSYEEMFLGIRAKELYFRKRQNKSGQGFLKSLKSIMKSFRPIITTKELALLEPQDNELNATLNQFIVTINTLINDDRQFLSAIQSIIDAYTE